MSKEGWKAELTLRGWLYQCGLPASQTVTHPSINWAQCRVTTLIETSTLPLSQPTTGHVGCEAYHNMSCHKTGVVSVCAGVLLWEIFTGGDTPYSNIDAAELVDLICMHSGRLAQPDNCPDVVYSVMQGCWFMVCTHCPDVVYSVMQGCCCFMVCTHCPDVVYSVMQGCCWFMVCTHCPDVVYRVMQGCCWFMVCTHCPDIVYSVMQGCWFMVCTHCPEMLLVHGLYSLS